MKITGNEPATPFQEWSENDFGKSIPLFMPESNKGLTIRQRFAMAAMQGFCANKAFESTSAEGIAALSVEQADALINALNQEVK